MGHQVFGRPPDYDTATDNIVRVHASMLRKRLEQYFASDGAGERLVIEIPKGNYAPLFRPREAAEIVEPMAEAPPARDWRLSALAALALLLAGSTAYFAWRAASLTRPAAATPRPAVLLFWSRIFQPNRQTDLVMDDAALALYQELSGRAVSLSTYFDRTYLGVLPGENDSTALALRRQSSYAGTNFLWKLFKMPDVGQRTAALRFARDYSFRELKANNAVLLGNSHSNPWIEPFEPRLGLRWAFDDKATGNYGPVDTWSAGQKYGATRSGETHEGYCAVSLLPNLTHSGAVLIVSGTGGSAVNACADFLADESAVAALRARLPGAKETTFSNRALEVARKIEVSHPALSPEDLSAARWPLARPPYFAGTTSLRFSRPQLGITGSTLIWRPKGGLT